MVNVPHIYYINKWFGGLSTDTALMYRTNDLDDFVKHVEEFIQKHHLGPQDSRTIVRGNKTFFSYYVSTEWSGHSWHNPTYFSMPDKTYHFFEDYKEHAYKASGRKYVPCQNFRTNQTYMTS